MKILEITRGHLKIEFDSKTTTIFGEGLLDNPTSINYIVYSNSLINWDPPHDNETIDDASKIKILDELKGELNSMGLKAAIE